MNGPHPRSAARSPRVHTRPAPAAREPVGFVPMALARMRTGMSLQFQLQPQSLGRGAMLHPLFNFTQA